MTTQGYCCQAHHMTALRETPSHRPPVLLVHGWAGSFDRTWVRGGLVDLLRDTGRDVLAFDLPGHGAATKSHDPADYADLASSVFARLDASSGATDAVTSSAANTRTQPVDAIGFSLGAITLLAAVVRAPERFNRVVLAGIGDGVFLPHDPRRTEKILAGLEGRSAPDDLTARIFGKIGNEAHNDPLALAAVLRRPRQEPFTKDQLAAVTCEMLIAIGDKDFSQPATQLAAAFRRARLKTLTGVDHFRTPESFDFIDAVLDFLES
ncbi:MAG: alpha/beta fold hydrolase [Actinobacteria bacterium]|nr:alpha/beta fold hydrolase [Actinomycetota bacterium]